MAHAKCAGLAPAVFFPSDGAGVEAAKKICADCPVRTECLQYALAHRIAGVWGGTSERERRRMVRRRRDVARL